MPFSRLGLPLRRFRLKIERARLARRVGELRELFDVPHDLAEVARAKVDRLIRRDRALGRLIG